MPIGNAEIDLTVTDPSGAVTHPIITTDLNGAGAYVLVPALAGDYTIVATSQGATSNIVTITAVAPPPPTLTLTPSATKVNVGDPVTIAITLESPPAQ
jgi:hypothetical protein